MVPVARAASTGARARAGRLLVMVAANVRIDEPFDARHVPVPLFGHLNPGEVRLGPIGELADDDRHQDEDADCDGRALAARDSPTRFRLPVASGHVSAPVAEAYGSRTHRPFV